MNTFSLPDERELSDFLALTPEQRGKMLFDMQPSRRIAYAVAYAKRRGIMAYQALDTFERWKRHYLNSLNART